MKNSTAKRQISLKLMSKVLYFLLVFAPLINYSQTVDELLKSGDPAGGFTPYLRIGIKVDVSSIQIEGDADVFNKNGKKVAKIQGSYQVTTDNRSIKVGNRKISSDMVRFSPQLMMIKVGKKMFRGDIEVHAANGKLTVVNDLFIEDYVRGVINKEAIPSWPIEAKKTQAVLARTFAVYQKMFNPRSKLFDLAPSVLDQVYGGLNKEDVTSNKAVDQTKGEVITVGNHPAQIFFHSTCGGQTASAEEVWGKEMSHLQSVKCAYCKKSSLYRWKRKIPSSEISEKLKKAGYKVRKSGKIKVSIGKLRVNNVIVDGVSIPVNKFRAALGFSKIWSNDFEVRKSGGNYIFEGKGAGHGVGVCQWGMAGMAGKGKKYREILKYYLKGIEIRKMY